MGRPPCCDRSNVKRGLWTAEEDAKILAYVSNHGIGNWTLVPKKAGLNRCGKSCRLRWTNYLRPDLKHDNFTPEEEELIISLHEAIGSRWSLIAKRLPGRTDNDVKNYWNTKLRKKLQKMGIDPVTHKPFSQILSDFGNISGISNPSSQFVSLNKTLNTNMISQSEPPSVLTRPSASNTTMINPMIMEQIQQNSSNNNTNNPPLEFLSQFHIISHETLQPHQFFNHEVTSSCSSSSSTPFTRLSSPRETLSCTQQSQADMITPSSPYMWSDFLLSDPVLSMDCQQQEKLSFRGGYLPTNPPALINFNNHQDFKRVGLKHLGSCDYGTSNGNQSGDNLFDAASSSASSFVDGILDRDREMLSQFPQLLDPSLHDY